ncbi:MAG: dihydropteroate synthase, partial [Actinomycetota bacterium]|nr:dihydropteroate synthase [Actinomycetota bacterium]
KFLGEVLDTDKDGRLEGTLAATAWCAAQGGRVFRAHQVAATRRVLDTVGAIRGTQPPAVTRRALA